MWLYFNREGQLITSLEHGELAFAGTTAFSIYAVFEDVDSSTSPVEAIIKLFKPDLYGNTYPLLLMKKEDRVFEKLDGEGDTGAFVDNTTYHGFYFDFGDFDNDLEQDNVVLLDTDGLWRAVITLVRGRGLHVQGVATFSVGDGIVSQENTEINIDALLVEIYDLLSQKPDYENVIVVIEDIPSSVEDFEEGQLFYNKADRTVYIKSDGELIPYSTFMELNIENGTGTFSLKQHGNIATGDYSLAVGYGNIASNIESMAQGYETQARGNYSHSEGAWNISHADISHTEGQGNVVGDLTEGDVPGRLTGQIGHAEGTGNLVLGYSAHAEGYYNLAKGDYSHVEGIGANDWAHPENSEIALKKYDDTNYIQCDTFGGGLYVGGNKTIILNTFSNGTQSYTDFRSRLSSGNILAVVHSSGVVEEFEVYDLISDSIRVNGTIEWASDDIWLRVELKQADNDIASGTAYGVASHVGGYHNYALKDNQTVFGKYNNNKSDTLFEVGNGTDHEHRSNALEVRSDGRVSVGAAPVDDMDVVTKQYADSVIAGVYKPQGSATVVDLNNLTKTATMNGYVYNMSNGGTLNQYGGLTISVQAGDNVAFIWNNGIWYWDDMVGFIDTSNLVDKSSPQTITGVKTWEYNTPIYFYADSEQSQYRFGIGSTSGYKYRIARYSNNGSTLQFGIDLDYNKIVPTAGNQISLGDGTYTFKDLNLSGNIYLGGANTSQIQFGNANTYIKTNADNDLIIKSSGGAIWCERNVKPSGSNLELGGSSAKWKNGWIENLKGVTTMTQAQYDALVSGGTVDADTLYFIEEE